MMTNKAIFVALVANFFFLSVNAQKMQWDIIHKDTLLTVFYLDKTEIVFGFNKTISVNDGEISGRFYGFNGSYITSIIDYKNDSIIDLFKHLNRDFKIDNFSFFNNLREKDSAVFNCSFFKNGKIHTMAMYRDKQKNGLNITFSASGRLMFVEYYTNDERDGPYLWFSSSGRLIAERRYRKNTLDGLYISYGNNGIPKLIIEFDMGRNIYHQEINNKSVYNLLKDVYEKTTR
ncbi:toxin-antitoxin system YwqK family antitoxin [Flavobacterium sp.]|uniref:toxin-antitoxin system YwqK family antitoxin n=1 Tax=Flavobacterium sp. TaxID=239 RepID=UPI0040344747